jgi:DNA repair exonuclease SbcCD ATPase subunit
MSYSDQETTLPIGSLGQCLITGEVIEEDFRSDLPVKRSNGAGKSTIPSVIQWVLFGRTMHSAQPGNKVVNFFTKKDCWAKLTFKNGDSITRTRNVNGHNELIFVKNGDEHTLVSDTQSTTKIQQAKLAKEFNLDWEIFCGSVFFNQYGRSWMEMPDASRKKAIERILHVDKFIYRAQVAKNRLESSNSHINKLTMRLESVTKDIDKFKNDITRIENSSENYIQNQKSRQLELLKQAKSEKEQRDNIQIPDIEKITKQWDIIDQINFKITNLEKERTEINNKINSLSYKIDNLKQQIQLWHDKSGKVCVECEQDIPQKHTDNKIQPLQQKLNNLESEHQSLIIDQNTKDTLIQKTKTLLESKKPDITIANAKSQQALWDRHNNEFKRMVSAAKQISTEINPHVESIAETEELLEKSISQKATLEKDISRYDFQTKHLQYIYKAYNDRKKIKSYIFQEHIPFINQRLRHYLDVFDLDVWIELTPSLGIKSNMWGYEFESGGERKRTDVAFMFAIFDFHEQMYGRQSNLLILDEVDGRLDDYGIDALINIIKNDLAPKVETILIISHRNLMFDVFPREIKVTRTNRISQLQVT